MKKFIAIIFIIAAVIFAGEFFSNDMTEVKTKDGQTTWQVNHFFNLYKTTIDVCANDTLDVVVTAKDTYTNVGDNETLYRTYVNVIDTTASIKYGVDGKEYYDAFNKGDTVKLVKKYTPKKPGITKNFNTEVELIKN